MKRQARVFFQLTILVLSTFLCPAARTEVGDFSESSLRMMRLEIEQGPVIAESFPTYSQGARFFLPLGELASEVGLQIKVSSGLGEASGFVIDEDRKFHLIVKNCSVEHDGVSTGYACDETVIIEDEIYINSALVEKILPLRIKVDPYRSIIRIVPKQKLPAQVGVEREGPSPTRRSFDPGYPRVGLSHKRFDGFIVDQQIGFVATRSPGVEQNVLTHDTALAGELFGMEASAFLGGQAGVFERQRFTLARRDPNGRLLGDLAAREVQLLDSTLPSVPLLGGGGVYRGVSISSFPLQQSSQYGSRDFIGDLPTGWEVELYQNEVLIDRRISFRGSYEFRNIPLLYGDNRFRLAFYGPQGQRRETLENYSIDSSFLRPGQSAYRVAVVDGIGSTTRILGQYDQSLAKNFTLLSAIVRMPLENRGVPTTYGVLGARGFAKGLLLSSTVATNEFGGSAWENSILAPAPFATVGATYTTLNSFTSELFQPERGRKPRDILKGNLGFSLFSFPTVRLTLEGGRTHYHEGGSNLFYAFRQSTRTGPVQWNNVLNMDEGGSGLSGEFSPIATAWGSEIRMVFAYDSIKANWFSLELKKALSSVLTVVGGVQELWSENNRKYFTSLNREFKNFTLSANANQDRLGNFSAGGLLSMSLGRDPQNDDYFLKPKPNSSKGAASVRVFLDLNQNGVHDSGEPPLRGVGLRVAQADIQAFTDDSGRALLLELKPYEPADIAIAVRTLEDPFHRPSPRGLRFIPRPGKIAELDLPVIIASEVTGFVHLRQEQGLRPRRSVTIEVRDEAGSIIKTTRTEADGYFLIEDLRSGKYTIRIDPAQLRELKLQSEPAVHELEIRNQGFQDGVKDFVLTREKP